MAFFCSVTGNKVLVGNWISSFAVLMLLFYFRLRTRLSSERFLASGEDIQNSAGLEQSYPVQRSLDLEGNICHRSINSLKKFASIPRCHPLWELKSWSARKCCMSQARFIRRTFHVPNLIIRFGTWKVRHMNQLSSTDLYLGRPAVLFDWACWIERQKIDFNSYIDLSMCRI